MAIKLIGNYAKRLGLPGYSSHQYSVSVEIELSDSGNVQAEAARLYQLLQNAVDREIQQTGFVPTEDYGHSSSNGRNGTPKNGYSNGTARETSPAVSPHQNGDRWNCSDKQKELILKLAGQNSLPPGAVEGLAVDRFGVMLPELNRLQASGLIGELLETAPRNGKGPARNGKGGGR